MLKKLIMRMFCFFVCQDILKIVQNFKMVCFVYVYVCGSILCFYNWFNEIQVSSLFEGLVIWICGDCYIGNLGLVVNVEGKIDIQICDFDQIVIGNLLYDLICLVLLLVMVVCSLDLLGVIMVKMMEVLVEGYEFVFCFGDDLCLGKKFKFVCVVLKIVYCCIWKELVYECM